MKKLLVVLLCTFTFLFPVLTIVKTDNYVKAEDINNNKINLSFIKDEIDQKLKELQKEHEALEKKQEEIKEENTTIVQTSTVDNYVEEVEPVEETYYENYGTYGRLYVSWYSVALYDYNVNTNSSSSLQEIVNNDDSAAYYRNKGRLVIADHNYQGFSLLADLSEGTTSYIKFGDGSTIGYRLIKKSKGYNTGPDLVDTEGNSFFNMESDIIMYTCYEDGIMVTLWSLL